MSKSRFCFKNFKKKKINGIKYNLFNINDLCSVKRSRNMKMTVEKFENVFGIKLPYLSKELKKK